MNIYDIILNGYECDLDTFETALDHAKDFAGILSQEIEIEEQEKPRFSRYEDTINGVEIWYDFGADYYFFAVAKEEEK